MSLIKALITPVTPFQQNAPILFCEDTKKCAFVDPGGDLDILLGTAKDNNLIPEKILLTHGHIDHAGGASELASMLSIEIEGPHKEDTFLLKLPKVSSVKNTHDFIYEITFSTTEDMRSHVFDFAHDNGLKTLQLNQKNKNLEAVGLIFDGNIESLPGNFIFDDRVNRTVSVHAGGILAAIKYIYKADKLYNELMGK